MVFPEHQPVAYVKMTVLLIYIQLALVLILTRI